MATTYFKLNTLPFWILHLACFGIFFVPFSWKYVALAVALYYFRMFFVTAGYHRYFSHRTYQTSRFFQFLIAFFAMTSSQKGVLWWAAHHREHHRHSDQEADVHTPLKGWLWSHMGWILSDDYTATDYGRVKDLAKFPELLFLDRHWWIPPAVYLMVLTLTLGLPGVIWGFCVSTVFLWHGTFTINSLSHLWGSRRYSTTDMSRNNPVLAIVTLGEGWHNNHHHAPGTARNGFFWWEYDFTYYGIKMLSWFGLVWNLRPVPRSAYSAEAETESPMHLHPSN